MSRVGRCSDGDHDVDVHFAFCAFAFTFERARQIRYMQGLRGVPLFFIAYAVHTFSGHVLLTPN